MKLTIDDVQRGDYVISRHSDEPQKILRVDRPESGKNGKATIVTVAGRHIPSHEARSFRSKKEQRSLRRF